MASKLAQQSPAPEVQRTIIRSRRKTVSDKAQGFVVAVSLAATLLGWGFAANQDAQSAAFAAANTAQVLEVANTAQAVATATVPATVESVATVGSSDPVSTVPASVDQTATQATVTPVASVTQSSSTTTTTTRLAFTTTKSSR